MSALVAGDRYVAIIGILRVEQPLVAYPSSLVGRNVRSPCAVCGEVQPANPRSRMVCVGVESDVWA